MILHTCERAARTEVDRVCVCVCVSCTSGISLAFSMRIILTVSPPHWVTVSPWEGRVSVCISLSATLSWARSKACKMHTHNHSHTNELRRNDSHNRILFCIYINECVKYVYLNLYVWQQAVEFESVFVLTGVDEIPDLKPWSKTKTSILPLS